MDRTALESILQEKLAPQFLEVIDDSAQHAGHAGAQGGGRHFQVIIVSAAFEGKSAVERHRLIYDTLRDEMRQAIHALALTTRTPAEWSRR